MPKQSQIITLRVTKAEKVILGEAATTEGCSLNEYIRRRILNSAKVNSKIITEQAEPGNYYEGNSDPYAD